MKTISKSKLKAHMLRIFRELEQSGDELIITDRGRPALKIIPLNKGEKVRAIFADVEGKVAYHEDIETPTTDEWAEV